MAFDEGSPLCALRSELFDGMFVAFSGCNIAFFGKTNRIHPITCVDKEQYSASPKLLYTKHALEEAALMRTCRLT